MRRGSYASLLTYPTVKSVPANDWKEYDGEDADLSRLSIAPRNVTLTFAVTGGSQANFKGFATFLYSSAVHAFTFTELSRSATLRLADMGALSTFDILPVVSVAFVEDAPYADYTYVAPSASYPYSCGYSLGTAPFSDYGIRVLEGSWANVNRRPAVKELLVRNLGREDGQTYDENPLDTYSGGQWSASSSVHGALTVSSRDFTIHCLLRAPTFSEAWRNYDAFFYDWTKAVTTTDPTAACVRTLSVAADNATIRCYYKSQNVVRLSVCGTDVWLEFDMVVRALDGD